MAPQASTKCGLLPPDHQQIGCYTSNSLNSEQVLGTFSVLTISLLSPQTSAQREKRFLTPFLSPGIRLSRDVAMERLWWMLHNRSQCIRSDSEMISGALNQRFQRQRMERQFLSNHGGTDED